MIVKKAEIIATAVKKEQYPQTLVPEIAFSGKSNVGKSSMINALLNRRNLARTSSSPGKTQTLNFYNVNDTLNFVDLPGYGYAKVSKESKSKWELMINTYLKTRPQLREIVLLVDIRHEPNNNDIMMYNWIKSCGFKGYVIASKADKLSRSQQIRSIEIIKKALNVEDKTQIFTFSSQNKTGVLEIWNLLEELVKNE